MIAKKNSRYDLERKRIVLFQIGLLVASSFTLAAFTYKSPTLIDDQKQTVAAHKVDFQVELIEKEKVEVEIKDSQDNSNQQTTVDLNAAPSEDSKKKKNSNTAPDPSKIGLEGLGYKLGDHVHIGGEDIDIEGEVFDIVDTDAAYIGGYAEMQKFINIEVRYPEEAMQWGDQGTVYVSFIVETDGSISNVGIERGVSDALDREAKRVVRQFPKWIPAELNYANVRARVRLPITFTIGD